MLIEEMVCKSLGHKWKTVPLSEIPLKDMIRFPSHRALQAMIEMSSTDANYFTITYCGRCLEWDIDQTFATSD